jgi:hypothetical protein
VLLAAITAELISAALSDHESSPNETNEWLTHFRWDRFYKST